MQDYIIYNIMVLCNNIFVLFGFHKEKGRTKNEKDDINYYGNDYGGDWKPDGSKCGRQCGNSV